MSSRRFARLLAPLLALVLVAGACSSDPPQVVVSGDDPTTTAKDLMTTLRDEGFTVFAALLAEAGLTDELVQGEGDDTFTLFAPSDAAFNELSPGLVELFLGDDDVVAPAPGQADADGAAPMAATDEDEAEDEAEATAGDETATGTETGSEDDGTVDQDTEDSTDDVTVVEPEDDEVATPIATPISAPVLTERPSRAEIDALLADILHNHVVEGTTLAADLSGSLTTIEGSPLTIGSREEPPASEDGAPTTIPTVDGVDISATDLRATNGVIHTVDSLLVPDDRAAALDQLAASIPVTTDVLSTLAATGEHTELLAALQATGLDAELLALPAVTLFAPTDAAFAALSDTERAALADPDVLADVLQFHVLTRSVATTDIANRRNVRTLEGQTLDIVRTLIRAEVPEDEEGDEDAAEGDEAEETTTTTAPPPEEVFSVEGVEIDSSIATTSGYVHLIGALLVPDSATGPGGFPRR